MKRIIIALAVLLNSALMIAQTEFDAQKLMQTDINGTARYMGLAGAMGALGGDASAIKDNPAGLGVYRKSEFTGTINWMNQGSSSSWYDKDNNSGGIKKNTMNNLSYVMASPSGSSEGLVSSNWSFGFNRLRNFDREVSITGSEFSSPTSITDYMAYFTNGLSNVDLLPVNTSTYKYNPYSNSAVPWISEMAYQAYLINPILDSKGNLTTDWTSVLPMNQYVTPSYKVRDKGFLDEYSLSWAGNFDNKLYFGAAGNLRTFSHNAYSHYKEEFGNGYGLDLIDTTTTKGAGVNLNVGLIYRPNDVFRFGFSFHTPTLYAVQRDHYSTLVTKIPSYLTNNDTTYLVDSPIGSYNFNLQDPMKINASVAIVLGKFGLISAEYDYCNYQGMQLLDNNGSTSAYSFENSAMKTNLNDVGTIKLGVELKITDNFALRAGYANSTASTKNSAVKLLPSDVKEVNPQNFLHNYSSFYSGGIGYRNSGFFADLAYVRKVINESFTPYNSLGFAPNVAVNEARVLNTYNNIVLTVGFRF
jgi:long-subunit fatty acid transport protein